MSGTVTGRRPLAGLASAVAALAALALAPASGVAQDPRDTLAKDPLEIRLQLNTSRHENFFQAAPGRPDTTVRAGAVRVRFTEGWIDGLGAEGYVDGRATVYDGFAPTYGTGGGLRLAFWAQRFDVGLDYDWRLPRLDVGDAVGRADVGVLRGDYALRLGRLLELSALGRFRRERKVGSDPPLVAPEGHRDPWTDHAFTEWGGAARLLALGRILSPELGMAYGRPRGVEPAQAYEQRQRYLQLRSMPHPRLYLGARLRVRDRTYLFAPPDAGNFGRRDTREQLTLLADVRLTDAVSTVVYYAREEAESSRAYRDFTTQSLSLGLTLRRD